MKNNPLELVVGLFVLAGLIAIGYLALQIGAGQLAPGATYALRARFTNASGLNPGSNVVVAGVPVGRVEHIQLNPKDFSAQVDFRVTTALSLPTDSIASIRTSGLIGDKFLALLPGSDTESLKPGALIVETESTVDLESLISRFAFGNVEKKSTK